MYAQLKFASAKSVLTFLVNLIFNACYSLHMNKYVNKSRNKYIFKINFFDGIFLIHEKSRIPRITLQKYTMSNCYELIINENA